jgi:hypothetical protein
MEAMRNAWTDERLDDLNHRVDDGFKEMQEEFRAVRLEVGATYRTLLQVFLGGFGLMLVGFAGTIATILTQA